MIALWIWNITFSIILSGNWNNKSNVIDFCVIQTWYFYCTIAKTVVCDSERKFKLKKIGVSVHEVGKKSSIFRYWSSTVFFHSFKSTFKIIFRIFFCHLRNLSDLVTFGFWAQEKDSYKSIKFVKVNLQKPQWDWK